MRGAQPIDNVQLTQTGVHLAVHPLVYNYVVVNYLRSMIEKGIGAKWSCLKAEVPA